MTALEYVLKLITDVVNGLKGMSLSAIGLPNMTMFNFAVAALVGFTALTLLGKDDSDDD